jgi:hypothetical protein
MDPCSLPESITVEMRIPKGAQGPFRYKLPQPLIKRADIDLYVAPVRLTTPQFYNVSGDDHWFHWSLVEEDTSGNRLVSPFQRGTLNGFFESAHDMWAHIISSVPPITVGRHVGNLNMRRASFECNPSELLLAEEVGSNVKIHTERGSKEIHTVYDSAKIAKLQLSLALADEVHMLMFGRKIFNALPFDLTQPETHSFLSGDTRYQSTMCHVIMRGIDAGYVNGRMMETLAMQPINATSTEFAVILNKKLNPQWSHCGSDSWTDFEFDFQDSAGRKVLCEEGYFHLLLSLRWMRSSRTLLPTVTVQDAYGC